jgi:hypothetical protein
MSSYYSPSSRSNTGTYHTNPSSSRRSGTDTYYTRSSTSTRSSDIKTPTSYYHPTYLPGDEFRMLQKRQERERLEHHFEHRGHSNHYINPRTPYQDVGLSPDARLRISAVKNATRTALGPSFDFTDDSYNRSQRCTDASSVPSVRRGADKSLDPIPQRYIDEFNKKWRDDDLKYDAHQYAADMTHNTPWRAHAPMYVDIKPLPRQEPLHRPLPQTTNSGCFDGGLSVCEPRSLTRGRPALVSKFSCETLDEPPKRTFWRRSRR